MEIRVVYVAGKFRGPDGWVIAENIRAAERRGYEVAAAGAMPLIPHANTAMFHGTFNDQFWLDGTMELLRRCDAVVTVPGWEASVGAKAEVEEARKRGMPVFETIADLRSWLGVDKGLKDMLTDVAPPTVLRRARDKLGPNAIIGTNAQFPDAPFHVGVQVQGEWKWFGAGKTWDEALSNVKKVKFQKSDRSFVYEEG